MPDVTTAEQELHLALRALGDKQDRLPTYDYIRQAYEEQLHATRCSWEEIGKYLQVAIDRIGNEVDRE